jgi:hypothetical protein
VTDTYSATCPLPYREFARAIRAFAPTLGYPEARNELLLLAAHYEKLAGFVEAVARLTPTDDA